jgi:hypothetical protein
MACWTAATVSCELHAWLLITRHAVAYETFAARATLVIDMP